MDPRKHLGWELALAALVVLALSGPSVVESARILAVIPMPAPSHHMAISGVLKALANKGHDITLFSGLPKGNKINPSNTKLFHLELPAHSRAKDEMNAFWDQSGSELDHLKILFHFGMVMCNETLHDPLFKAEVNKPGQSYDLIIVEAFFFQESLVGLGHQFNAPVVAIHANGGDQWLNTIMGNPVNPALVPIPHLGFSDRMSLIERARNALSLVISHYLFTYTYVPMQDALLHEHWPDAPSLVDLMRSRIGVTLINNHFTLTFPLPLSRNIVEIGGIQMPESTNPLPKDLQEYLDGAEKGVVYFSMGSNLKLEFVPEQKSRAILDALGGLKEKVLLKWDGPAPKNISPNIRVIKWAPQADLLTHPNIRAFVTHGGLLSTQESVYHAVPVVGIPVFGDQTFNMAIASAKGFGIPVDFKTLTKETLSVALKEVLENPKYKESASRLSRLFRAKPMSPAESAVWAVEHVLHHGGDHLWPASVSMPLYQILMLDLVLLGFSPVIALLLIVWVLCRGKTQKVNKRKKNN